MATNIGRIGLTHPDLGTAGGSALWTQINTIYQTLGDAISGRLFTGTALASAGTATFTHGFQVAFAEIHYRLYAYNHSTGAIGAQVTTGWTVSANISNPTTQVDVLNSSGSPADFALIMIHDGNRKLSEHQDVDFTTSPQDGQALVYDGTSGTWKPGASGDASFKLQSIATPNLVLKGGGNSGGLFLADGRVLKTYSGSGSTSTSYGVDLTMSLTTILGSAPANATAYWLAIDLDSLGTQQTISDTNEKVYQVTISNFVLLLTDPLLQNRARYASVGEIKSATTGTAWSGTGSAFRTLPVRLVQNIPVAVSPIASRPATGVAVGTIGSSAQIAAGHVLTAKSFPSSLTAANISYYNLTGLTDGSGNARSLTNSGTPVLFTANGIFGGSNQAAAFVGASSERLFSRDVAFFNPSVATPWTVAAWVKPTSTAAGQSLFGTQRYTGGTTINFLAFLAGGGGLNVYDSSSPSVQVLSVPSVFTAGVYVHIALRYDGVSTLYIYANGKQIAQTPYVPGTVTSPEFTVGANANNGTPANFFTGEMDELVMVSGSAMTDSDVAKLAAYRYDHNAAVLASNQRWYAAVYPNGGEPVYQPATSWLISKGDTNSVFWDFSDLASTDTVDVVLEDLGLSPMLVTPVPPFDTTYTADPTGTIAHGQPDVPEVLVLQEDGTAGQWVELAPLGIVAADATNLTVTASHLTIGASPNRLRIIARPARLATVGVPNATTARQGTIQIKSPTIQSFLSGSGTYTTPNGVAYLRVRMIGGGGGGSGGGTSNGGGSTAGGNTTFGTSLLVANGGAAGVWNGGSVPVGGTASLGAASGIAVQGGGGTCGSTNTGTVADALCGGPGASTPFGGGGGGGGAGVGVGQAATANSGAGGGAGGTNATTTATSGAGGAAGGFVDAIIAAPNPTYSYAVGGSGTAGTLGGSGFAGGAGGSGVIIVEEHYY